MTAFQAQCNSATVTYRSSGSGPVAWRTPPRHYGPWEQVTSLIAEGLVARGVDVTLFATLDSLTAAKLEGVCARGYAEDATLDGQVTFDLDLDGHGKESIVKGSARSTVHSAITKQPGRTGGIATLPPFPEAKAVTYTCRPGAVSERTSSGSVVAWTSA